MCSTHLSNSHSSTHLTVDKIIWDANVSIDSQYMCAKKFMRFIRWFVHWRNHSLCDSINVSMNVLGAYLQTNCVFFLHRCWLVLLFSLLYIYMQNAIWIESNQTRHNAKKNLHKDTYICQFWPSFVYLIVASQPTFFWLFVGFPHKCDLSDRCAFLTYCCVLFLAIAFSFCFSFDYLLLFNFYTIGFEPLLPLRVQYIFVYMWNTLTKFVCQTNQWSLVIIIIVVVVVICANFFCHAASTLLISPSNVNFCTHTPTACCCCGFLSLTLVFFAKNAFVMSTEPIGTTRCTSLCFILISFIVTQSLWVLLFVAV